jgi:hypothetical protein
MQNRFRSLILATLFAVFLSGCWHVPLSALWRLKQVDLLTIDPAGVRLAARAPDWLEAPPGHAHLLIVGHIGEPDEKEELFDLIERDTPADLRALAGEAQPGTHFAVFRASAADIARLRDIQAQARAAKAAGDDRHKGKLLLKAEPCRRIDPPPGPARVDLYLSLSEKEDFFKIYDDIDLRDPQLLGDKFETAVPLCAKTVKRAE